MMESCWKRRRSQGQMSRKRKEEDELVAELITGLRSQVLLEMEMLVVKRLS